MEDVLVKSVDKEKQFGIMITRDLKPSYQCTERVKN